MNNYVYIPALGHRRLIKWVDLQAGQRVLDMGRTLSAAEGGGGV